MSGWRRCFRPQGRELEAISNRIFEKRTRETRRKPERRYEAIMLRIGQVQRLLARLRESSVSGSRMLGFLAACDSVHRHESQLRHIQSLIADARALDDHSDFLAENLNFLLDASGDQRISNAGVLVMKAQRFRSQDRNREASTASTTCAW